MSPSSRKRSEEILRRAEASLVGGVNSPVRAFKAVGGAPLVIDHAAGSRVFDADGREYIDYICSWGALILGHAHPAVTEGIREQAGRGTSYGATTALEVELAERVKRAFPSVEKIRFVNSGTEATMSAARLARAFTGRDFLLKFEGGYHGHADSFLAQAGSGLATLGIASSPGVPEELARLTISVPYNDLAAVEKAFGERRGKIAAVILEPYAANMGFVRPEPGFLKSLREMTAREGALLIFDEVITGFRVAYGGVQTLAKIEPDLTTLGKIIGGGLPIGAYGGRREIMDLVAPTGSVYQAGTLAGNPLVMRAGIEAVKQIEAAGFYDELCRKSERLAGGIAKAIAEAGAAACADGVTGMMTLFFLPRRARNYDDVKKADTRRFAVFFREMLARGILIPPSQFEVWFASAAHSDADIERTLEACRASFKALAARATAD